jgi:hypothetical protein
MNDGVEAVEVGEGPMRKVARFQVAPDDFRGLGRKLGLVAVPRLWDSLELEPKLGQ